jgi:hypothetical protein
MPHRDNRPRAIAVTAPAPYAGPGHLVLIVAAIVLALYFASHAHAAFLG